MMYRTICAAVVLIALPFATTAAAAPPPLPPQAAEIAQEAGKSPVPLPVRAATAAEVARAFERPGADSEGNTAGKVVRAQPRRHGCCLLLVRGTVAHVGELVALEADGDPAHLLVRLLGRSDHRADDLDDRRLLAVQPRRLQLQARRRDRLLVGLCRERRQLQLPDVDPLGHAARA